MVYFMFFFGKWRARRIINLHISTSICAGGKEKVLLLYFYPFSVSENETFTTFVSLSCQKGLCRICHDRSMNVG